MKEKKEVYITLNKKVVAVSFLALALFMLLAVSYAYFTATVEGNDQAEKVTVKTGEMKLKLVGPTEVTAENLLPGQKATIEFSVENMGNVPATYNLDMIEVLNNFDPKSDLVYSVESTNGGGQAKDVEAPSQAQTLIRNIYIGTGEEKIQKYTLTIEFKETYVNQNSNQGKTFEGKVQINNLEDNSLATTILRSNPIQSEILDFSLVSPDYNEIDHGKGIFLSEDGDGASYYFRGAVDNNNVKFANTNMKWKIIRINGDGTIRLILTSDIGQDALGNELGNGKYATYTYNNNHDCTNNNPCISDYQSGIFAKNYGEEATDSLVKTKLEKWYIENLAGQDDKIALTTYCNDSSLSNDGTFESKQRLSAYPSSSVNPILTCPNPVEKDKSTTHNYGGVYKLKIGMLTIDEAIMIGAATPVQNDYILGHHYLSSDIGMSMTLVNTSYYYTTTGGHIFEQEMDWSNSITPVINLKSDVAFTGTGTADDPYIVE